jgi:adenylosuccinate lyase
MSLSNFTPPLPNKEKRFNGIDPLDGRYFDPEISQYLSEESRILYQAHVEAALAHTLADFGLCSESVANEIDLAAHSVRAQEVSDEEEITKHDVKALVNVIKSKISDEAKPFVHMTATSYDIVSTASAAQFKAATQNLLLPRIQKLSETLRQLADRYKDTVQIGRTHGQHGVPITFGFAISEYVSRLEQSHDALQELAGVLQGKFSGAVGSYNALGLFVDDPKAFEKSVMDKLGLVAAPVSTQIVPPESLARLLIEATLAAGAMANLATDMRQLQRSEIAEIREKFDPNQTGSSTMAHKRNPISFENVVSLYKEVVAQNMVIYQNAISEHQRDLTDSASARFYPVLFGLVAQMASKLNSAMSKIEVDEQAMQRNLHLSGGAIAAEPLYLLLAKHGHTQAHEEAKRVAHFAMDNNISYAEAVQKDAELGEYWNKFTDRERDILANPETNYTGLAGSFKD